MKALRDVLTGKDNATHDVARWSWLICLISIIMAALVNAWVGRVVIDLVLLATAEGLVVAAHSAALKIKAETEPDPPKESP
jgi:hypothetical protein